MFRQRSDMNFVLVPRPISHLSHRKKSDIKTTMYHKHQNPDPFALSVGIVAKCKTPQLRTVRPGFKNSNKQTNGQHKDSAPPKNIHQIDSVMQKFGSQVLSWTKKRQAYAIKSRLLASRTTIRTRIGTVHYRNRN